MRAARISAYPVGVSVVQLAGGTPHRELRDQASDARYHASRRVTTKDRDRRRGWYTSHTMRRRRLGRSGLNVSEICLGTMTFGSMADEPTSKRILDQAVDAGVDFLDVAEVYPVPPDPKWA